MPLFHLIWSIFLIFLLVAWIWVLVGVIADIFASDDMGGGAKALWLLGVMILPWLGVLLYLLLRGDKMQERSRKAVEQAQEAQKAYIRDVAGTGVSAADEIEKLAALKEKGVLSEEEFAAQKAKLLA